MNQRVCRRCLLMDQAGGALAKSLREYVESIPDEERAEEALYRMRLEVCRKCDQLMQGVCRQCGCFVEARAARRAQSCPAVPSRWAAVGNHRA